MPHIVQAHRIRSMAEEGEEEEKEEGEEEVRVRVFRSNANN